MHVWSGETPVQSKSRRPSSQPLSGVPITLINSRAKGRLRVPVHSWLLGKSTLECVRLQPCHNAERQERFCFTLQSAKQMKNERGLHRLIQVLMLFRQHSAP